ncbi:SHOCT domain-containing protein [Desulfotomaculum nigrificans]|uniref:SHOCT domain-containing protein n=1 Tax=Desulfotomaculum nigrificans TaxID=1565 RepID=UPI0001FAE777|nr:SHOCT domain-containing protein [Desulfotomaculum nigrificans]MDA8235908.1 SHOCT domain-containing protein [Clostridia bacterium]
MWCGGYGMGWPGMGMMSGVGGWVGMILSMLVPIVIVGLIIYGLLKVVKRSPGYGSSAALEVLGTRYAKNEITEEEYKRMKEQLSR